MDEIKLIAILVSLGVLFLVSYVIVLITRQNQRFEKVNKLAEEMIITEKELDRTESMGNVLHLR